MCSLTECLLYNTFPVINYDNLSLLVHLIGLLSTCRRSCGQIAQKTAYSPPIDLMRKQNGMLPLWCGNTSPRSGVILSDQKKTAEI